MDYFSIHAEPLPRRMPLGIRLETLGHVPQKKSWVRTTFETINFSFIVEGAGRYMWNGQWLRIEAPMVITQWPGVVGDYGPDEGASWYELYLIYDKLFLPELRRLRFADESRPVWQIGAGTDFAAAFAEFVERWYEARLAPDPDELDRDCERLIYSSLKPVIREPQTPEEAVVRKVKDELKLRCSEALDINEIAARHGLSGSTLRRYWARYNPQPPWQFVIELRMRRACRLLAETRLRVGEIADRTGFRDQLYFSRKFREKSGMSPREYRNRYRINT